MENDLLQIRNWVAHGTLSQFLNDASARLSTEGYTAEMDGNTICFYRVGREGGFLGIGGHKVHEKVLEITRTESEVDISQRTADPKFVTLLARLLDAH